VTKTGLQFEQRDAFDNIAPHALVPRADESAFFAAVHESAPDVVDGCAGRPAKGRRWKSVTVKE
jgi:hypothetical protein